MALAVPDLSVVAPNDEVVQPSQKRQTLSGHVDLGSFRKSKEQRKEEEAEWLLKHNVSPVFNEVLMDIKEQKPKAPVAFFWAELTKTEVLDEASSKGSEADPRDLMQDLVAADKEGYFDNHQLPNLFNELIDNLLRDRPNDALGFTQAYLRFNAKRLMEAGRETTTTT